VIGAGRCYDRAVFLEVDKDRQQLIRLIYHLAKLLWFNQAAFRQQLQPKHGFVRFFNYNSKFSYKLSL